MWWFLKVNHYRRGYQSIPHRSSPPVRRNRIKLWLLDRWWRSRDFSGWSCGNEGIDGWFASRGGCGTGFGASQRWWQRHLGHLSMVKKWKERRKRSGDAGRRRRGWWRRRWFAILSAGGRGGCLTPVVGWLWWLVHR